MTTKTTPALLFLFLPLACGNVTPDDTTPLLARGDVAPPAAADAGAGGAAAGGSTGAAGAPAYDCAATVLPPANGTPDRPLVFYDFGGACTRGGGECLATEKAWTAAGPNGFNGTAHFAEKCSADPPPGMTDPALPGRGFCTSSEPRVDWADFSCASLHPEQIPPGWVCCSTPSAASVLAPASCGCPA